MLVTIADSPRQRVAESEDVYSMQGLKWAAPAWLSTMSVSKERSVGN